MLLQLHSPHFSATLSPSPPFDMMRNAIPPIITLIGPEIPYGD
jgi:hypothetical protein